MNLFNRYFYTCILYKCREVKVMKLSRVRLFETSWIFHGILQAGVGSCSLRQGIFPTQGSNPGLPHCRQILYQLSHKGSPRILEWVGYPFSSGSSWPRNWTKVSCTAGGFFSNWAIREAWYKCSVCVCVYVCVCIERERERLRWRANSWQLIEIQNKTGNNPQSPEIPRFRIYVNDEPCSFAHTLKKKGHESSISEQLPSLQRF